MACMEHECGACGHTDMDNTTWKVCPKCGSRDVSNCWDEANDDHGDHDSDSGCEDY